MQSAPKACREPLCGKTAVADGKGFCSDHKSKNSCASARAERYKHDEISQRYATTLWMRFRKWILAQNPMCQVIARDGEQCRNAATVVHHIWSPRKRPDLFVEASNVACVCVHHHPPDEGTEWWRVGHEYVKTEFRTISFQGEKNV